MNFIVMLNNDFMCVEGLLYIWMVEKEGRRMRKIEYFPPCKIL